MAMQPDVLSISPAPLLQIRDLTVEYAAGRGRSLTPALHKVGLDIWAGETVGILGESGAGKSTVARLLSRLYALTFSMVRFQVEGSKRSVAVAWSVAAINTKRATITNGS